MNKLTHVEGRILIRVDMQFKNNHTFSHGLTIKLERRYNDFDRKTTQPVQGTVISGDNIPEGALILFHHNGADIENHVLNAGSLSGDEIASDIKICSVAEDDCYAWKDPKEGDWEPCKWFDFAFRVFVPYFGPLCGIEPTILANTLYMRTGEYAGLIVRTVKASDYEMVFREPTTGREDRIIRCRPNGIKSEDKRKCREEEVIAIDHGLTKKLHDGKVLIGLNKNEAKTFKQHTINNICLLK